MNENNFHGDMCVDPVDEMLGLSGDASNAHRSDTDGSSGSTSAGYDL